LVLLLAVALIVGLLLVVALAVVGLNSVDCQNLAAVAQAVIEDGPDATCFDSSVLRVVSVGFAFASAAVGLVALLLALGYVFTTRFGPQLARFTGLAVVLGVIAWAAALID